MIPGGMGKLMKHAQDIQKRMEKLEEELKDRVVEGQAGGGVVAAFVNGRQELVQVKIRPDVVKPEETALLEDLVVAAVAAAQARARELRQKEMDRVTGGMKLPGMT